MVNPVYIFIISLGSAFLLPLIDRFSKKISALIFHLVLFTSVLIPAIWLLNFLKGDPAVQIFTAGFYPPVSINLQFGLEESFFVLLSNLMGFLTALFLGSELRERGVSGKVLILLLVMGINGMIMTRDLFNLFVFLEIASISTYALIASGDRLTSLSAGFKYMLAGGIASVLFLIGTIFLYRFTGTLNIDAIAASLGSLPAEGITPAIILLITAVLIELKLFPANGWALDVYQAARPGISAIISTASSGAVFFVFYKLLPLLAPSVLFTAGIFGMGTFIIMNLMGLRQTDARRLLGYSSIAQMGLMAGLISLFRYYGISMNMEVAVLIFGALFINHFLAKAGLFWLAGIIRENELRKWSVLNSYPSFLLIFACFLFALVGLPPFPSFWAKWQAILVMAQGKMSIWIWVVMIGSLLEAAYLFRWFGIVYKAKLVSELKLTLARILPVLVIVLVLLYSSLMVMNYLTRFDLLLLLPILIGAILNAFKLLPAKFKGVITIFIPLLYLYYLLPQLSGIYTFFGYIFLAASAVITISTLSKRGFNGGFFAPYIVLILSLGNLLITTTTLQFFYNWEIIALSSYLLVLRGNPSSQTALRYLLFSLGGAFLLLAGFAFAYAETGSISLLSLGGTSTPLLILLLLILGFLVKVGALGLHVWLPGAYAEADDQFSPALSAVVSKIGVFGILISLILLGKPVLEELDFTVILGWIGLLTAFFGALMAVFQEDIKYLLAYSSMGQVGYIILALAIFNHMGWVTAIYLSINHLLFKGILFMAVAGLIFRLRTRQMYKMGGLIKRMPFSFLAVLIAIIALSGVPPLSGFGGKWLLYTSLIEKGWYLQAGIAFFTSTIAFLYCFRLIHVMFLGQEKTSYRDLKEAPAWYLIPQYIFIMIIMAISTFPSLILSPISEAVAAFFEPDFQINGYNITSSLGNWNGNTVMMVTMGVFMLPLIWLLLRVKAVQKVKQFNIVYASERPDRPETTHFGHNFFPYYRKALGFLVKPLISNFWKAVSEWTGTMAGALRNIYTGSGQTYALQIILFVIVFYFVTGVVR